MPLSSSSVSADYWLYHRYLGLAPQAGPDLAGGRPGAFCPGDILSYQNRRAFCQEGIMSWIGPT